MGSGDENDSSYEAKLTREKNSYLLLNKLGDLSFFPNIFDLPFILFLFKELKKTHIGKKIVTRNALLTEMKSRPRTDTHVRKVLSKFRLMLRASAKKRLANCS